MGNLQAFACAWASHVAANKTAYSSAMPTEVQGREDCLQYTLCSAYMLVQRLIVSATRALVVPTVAAPLGSCPAAFKGHQRLNTSPGDDRSPGLCTATHVAAPASTATRYLLQPCQASLRLTMQHLLRVPHWYCILLCHSQPLAAQPPARRGASWMPRHCRCCSVNVHVCGVRGVWDR